MNSNHIGWVVAIIINIWIVSLGINSSINKIDNNTREIIELRQELRTVIANYEKEMKELRK